MLDDGLSRVAYVEAEQPIKLVLRAPIIMAHKKHLRHVVFNTKDFNIVMTIPNAEDTWKNSAVKLQKRLLRLMIYILHYPK